MRLIRFDDVAAAPWKNGGGVTRELLRLPFPPRVAATGDWLLRISIADIDANGPFSPFPGVSRSFAVLSGAGVRLDWPDGRTESLDPADGALDFDGGDAPGCILTGGRTRDLNVMVRQDAGVAGLQRAELVDAHTWGGRHRGVLALRTLVVENGNERHAVEPLTLAWRDIADTAAWALRIGEDDAAANAQNAGSGAPHAWWIDFRLDGPLPSRP